MRSKIGTLIGAFWAVATAGCVTVPPLEGFGVPVTELVRRVKCELLESVPEPVGRYQWMADWTAKVDLNLIMDERAGLTPTVSFIDLRDTAVIPKIGSIMQNFTFGLGAGVNTTATRNESLSFTISLKEIREKRMAYGCGPPTGVGLGGDLGLREWVIVALEPVETAELTPGHHKPPAVRSAGSSRSLKQAVERRMDAEKKLDRAQKERAGDVDLETKRRELEAAKRAEEKALEDLVEAERRGPAPSAARMVRLDPPIDSIAHQVQFVVLANASASPQWSLARFKGPSVNGSLAAISRSRTHTLNLVLGAPAAPGGKGTSGEQSRQLLNQNLRSLIVPVPSQ